MASMKCFFLLPLIVWYFILQKSEINALICATPNASPLIVSSDSGLLFDIIKEMNVVLNESIVLNVNTQVFDYEDERFSSAICENVDICVTLKKYKDKSDDQVDESASIEEDLLPLGSAVLARGSRDSWDQLEGTFFLYIFHSSVWSLMFLAFCIVTPLLIIFEYTNPLGYRLHHLWGKKADSLTLVQCILFTFSVIFMQSVSKYPKSLSGRALAAFWNMFCFVMFMLYMSAMVVIVLSHPFISEQSTAYFPLSELSREDVPVICSQNSVSCNLFKALEHKSDLMKSFEHRIDLWNTSNPRNRFQALQMSRNLSALLLTDNLLASYIESNASPLEGGYMHFTLAPSLTALVLRAPRNYTLQAKLNRAIVSLRRSGILNLLSQRWLGVNVDEEQRPASAAMELLLLIRRSIPIRVKTMYGPLVLLMIGIAITFFVACYEFLFRTFVSKQHLNEEMLNIQHENVPPAPPLTSEQYHTVL